jgi:hypothetical protein
LKIPETFRVIEENHIAILSKFANGKGDLAYIERAVRKPE